MKRLFSSMALVAALGAAPMLTGCNSTPSNPDYEARVKDSLKTANIDDVNAKWNADEKALHLSGDVETAADKVRAEELAQQVVGTSGRVVNEVKIEGTNADAVDNRIEQNLDRMFKEDDQWDKDNLDLSFDSNAGVVTIKGDAPSQAVKDRIAETVRKADGVKDVVNDLEVKPPSGSAAAPRTK